MTQKKQGSKVLNKVLDTVLDTGLDALYLGVPQTALGAGAGAIAGRTIAERRGMDTTKGALVGAGLGAAGTLGLLSLSHAGNRKYHKIMADANAAFDAAEKRIINSSLSAAKKEQELIRAQLAHFDAREEALRHSSRAYDRHLLAPLPAVGAAPGSLLVPKKKEAQKKEDSDLPGWVLPTIGASALVGGTHILRKKLGPLAQSLKNVPLTSKSVRGAPITRSFSELQAAVQPGDIIVTRVADPGVIPKVIRAAQSGDPWTHAALVGRDGAVIQAGNKIKQLRGGGLAEDFWDVGVFKDKLKDVDLLGKDVFVLRPNVSDEAKLRAVEQAERMVGGKFSKVNFAKTLLPSKLKPIEKDLAQAEKKGVICTTLPSLCYPEIAIHPTKSRLVLKPSDVAKSKKLKPVIAYEQVVPLVKKAEVAPGIPERKITPLPEVRGPQKWEFSAHPHEAERAGRHIDLRLGNPETGIAHSFVLPKGELPEPGKSRQLIPTLDHTVEYMDFAGEIARGYGKGKVTPGRRTVAEVYHSQPDDTAGTKLRFNLYEGDHPQEYAVVRTPKNVHLLVNKTQTRLRRPDIPAHKPKYKEHDIEKVDVTNAAQAMMPKLDGAHTIVDLKGGRSPRLFSYRVGKKTPTGLIEHTHKIPELLKKKVPQELDGTVLRAETLGMRGDEPVPAEQTGGLLNAKVWESRRKQQEQGVRLKAFPFNVIKYRGRDYSDEPFEKKRQVLKEIFENLPELKPPEIAITAEEKLKLLNDIKKDQHPLTSEGVVLVDRDKIPEQYTKAKINPDFDVFIRKVHPAISGKTGKPHDRAGAVSYSWTEKGPIAGQLGGFKHDEGKDMLQNPEKYVGRVAKVTARKVFPSGALFQPRFKEWHIDKGDIEKQAAVKAAAHLVEQHKEKMAEILPGDIRKGTPVTNDFKAFLKKVRPGDIVITKPSKGKHTPISKTINLRQALTKEPGASWTHTGIALDNKRLMHSFSKIKGDQVAGPFTADAKFREHSFRQMARTGKDFLILRAPGNKESKEVAVARAKGLKGMKFDVSGLLRAGLFPRAKKKGELDVPPEAVICTGAVTYAYPELNIGGSKKSALDLLPAEVASSKKLKSVIAFTPDKVKKASSLRSGAGQVLDWAALPWHLRKVPLEMLKLFKEQPRETAKALKGMVSPAADMARHGLPVTDELLTSLGATPGRRLALGGLVGGGTGAAAGARASEEGEKLEGALKGGLVGAGLGTGGAALLRRGMVGKWRPAADETMAQLAPMTGGAALLAAAPAAGYAAGDEDIPGVKLSRATVTPGSTGAVSPVGIPPMQTGAYTFGAMSAPRLDRPSWRSSPNRQYQNPNISARRPKLKVPKF